MNAKRAIQWIEQHGALLVYPIKNTKAPQSLWHLFFPRSEMKWEWDSDGDDRVADLWLLREELSRSKRVVYGKWFRHRATFFAPDVAEALISYLESESVSEKGLAPDSALIFRALLEASPQSTKALKKSLRADLPSAAFDKAQRSLWERLLITGQGEIDDGAFPSLSIGAMKYLHEAVWRNGVQLSTDKAEERLTERLGGTPFWDFAKRLRARKVPVRGVKKITLKQGFIRGEDLSLFSSPTLIKTR